MKDDFPGRLRDAFDNATMAAIARRLSVPHATVRNYFGGRMPSPEILIKIARETDVSLNWLLTGGGDKFVSYDRPVDIGRVLEQRIEQIVNAKLAERLGKDAAATGKRRETRGDFDVEGAVRKFNDPHRVMSEWFRYDGRKYPQDFGVVFFQGWESFTEAEKLDAIRDARKVLDRALKTRK